MKRRIYKKISIYICVVLLFCSLPFRVVRASNIQDDSKPIFGLTADDVVEKYNSLTEQQKKQVLRSLGNTSIFANSLFGNIFNSTFGALDDALEKIGDLFFQANGVIYKLGSSALAWVSRLIDKVFNNNLNDLNISQPVVNDFYINTRDLSVLTDPLFINGHKPSILDGYTLQDLFSPYPDTGYTDWICYGYYYASFGAYRGYYILPVTTTFPLNTYNTRFSIKGLFIDYDAHTIGLDGFSCFSDDVSALPQEQNFRIGIDGDGYWRLPSDTDYWVKAYAYSIYDWSKGSNYGRNCPPKVNFTDSTLNNVFSSYLSTYFNHIDTYYVKQNGHIYLRYIDHGGELIDLTNNTYYNFIYNIPDQTPLNVTNIVSNTAIDYNPVDNIAYYLPDQYNIEQNFTVVNNYYISSGSAITTGSPINVNLVSPSVIDVRITNPEDISNLVENNTIKQIINNNEFNAGDLNLNTTISTVIDSSNDSLSVVSNDSVGLISVFYLCIPSDLMGLYVVEVIVGIAVIWLNVVNHKHK